jgi:predicted alpha/beta hydrolase
LNQQPFELPDRAQTVIEWFGENTTADKGLVGFLPALGAGVEFYRPMAEAWAGLGYRVATVELRGGKQSSIKDVRAHNFGYNEVLNVDLASIVPTLRAEAAGRPFLLAGHSLGGQFALLYASRHPSEVDAVVLLAGGSNYYGAMPPGKRLTRHVGLRTVRAIDEVLRFFPGDKLGFGGRQPLNMMLDWTHEALTGKYLVMGDAADYDRDLEQLDMPVLMVSLRGDALVPRPSADYLARKLTRAQVAQIELHPDDGSPYHHFRWVKRPAPILAHVDHWIGAQFRLASREDVARRAAGNVAARMVCAGEEENHHAARN